MPSFTHTFEITVEVDYSYTPGALGSRGPFGEPMEPDDPPDVEINSIAILDDFVTTNVTENPIIDYDALKEEQREELRQLAFKNVEERVQDARELDAEIRYERTRDEED